MVESLFIGEKRDTQKTSREREGSSEKGGGREKKGRDRKPKDGGEEGREGGRRTCYSDGSHNGCSIIIICAAHLQNLTF